MPNHTERNVPYETETGRRGFMAASAGALLGAATASAGFRLENQKQKLEEPVKVTAIPAILVDDFVREDGDHKAWQRAVDAARERGVPTVVRGTASEYRFADSVILQDIVGLVIEGAGSRATVIRPSRDVELTAAFMIAPSATGAVRDLELRDIGFEGGLTNPEALLSVADESASVSRDGREFTDGSMASALLIHGDLADNVGTPAPSGTVENVRLRAVRVFGTRGLPIFINGVRGTTSVRDCSFELCLDVGFTFCDSVIFSDNIIRWSGDNGVSISRGTQNITCVANNIIGSYANGIWLGGFAGGASGENSLPAAAGADTAVVASNTIVLSGANGIWLGGGARKLTVAGNHVSQVVRRASDVTRTLTEADLTNESWIRSGNGVFVADFPAVDGNEGVLAHDIAITGNTFADCIRGGVLIYAGARSVSVLANTILRPGTPKAPNGETFSGRHGRSNYGISIPGADASDLRGEISNIAISGNAVIDDRRPERMIGGKADCITEYATYVNPGATNCVAEGNISIGVRSKQARPSDEPTIRFVTGDEVADVRKVPTGSMRLDPSTGRLMIAEGDRWRVFEAMTDG